MSTRIVIIDDHEGLREGVKSLLARVRPEWEICGEGTEGDQAIRLTQTLKPDLVILDISMPDISGLEACSQMRRLGIDIPILIFTTHDSQVLGDDSRQAGAQGYVVKSQAANSLVLAIEAILEGGAFFGHAEKRTSVEVRKPDSGIIRCQGFAFVF